MAIPLDSDSINHGIQLAIAPVFLLTAVSGMISAVASRLARIIDRARLVEDRAGASQDAAYLAKGELVARTCAWLSILIVLFAVVKSRVTKK